MKAENGTRTTHLGAANGFANACYFEGQGKSKPDQLFKQYAATYPGGDDVRQRP